jgi:hypothetical protein
MVLSELADVEGLLVVSIFELLFSELLAALLPHEVNKARLNAMYTKRKDTFIKCIKNLVREVTYKDLISLFFERIFARK